MMQNGQGNRRWAVVSLLVAAGATVWLLLGFALLAPGSAQAEPVSRTISQSEPVTQAGVQTEVMTAQVVVQLDAKQALVRPITFTTPISGLTALLRTGLDVTVAETSFGPAVCAIEGAGCPVDDCFCDANRYWSYTNWDGQAWQAYPVGASQSMISNTGALEGWRWGEGENPNLAAPQAVAAADALAWLRSRQEATTGGYGDSLSGAVEVMLALGANNESMAGWKPDSGSRSLADFVRLRATRYSRQGAAEAGKLAVAQTAADGCRTVRSLQPTAYFSTTAGVFAPDSGFNAWGILGTLALSQTVPPSTVTALAAQQQPDGGWEWQPGFGTDTNTTAVALQTLLATGYPITATEVVSGLAFLQSGQQPDGGFAYDPATPENGSDANSTAYGLMALNAAGEDAGGADWTVGGKTAVDFLLSLQLPDGSLEWQAGTGVNLMATAQAVPALLGRSYPLTVETLPLCRR